MRRWKGCHPPARSARASLSLRQPHLTEEHRRQGTRTSAVAAPVLGHRLKSCGSQAQLPRGMWDCLEPETQLDVTCTGRQTLHQGPSVSFLIRKSQFPDLPLPPRGSLQKLSCDLSALLHWIEQHKTSQMGGNSLGLRGKRAREVMTENYLFQSTVGH